jgi:septal ring factor EnvC (AmiA/AmiB activator)
MTTGCGHDPAERRGRTGNPETAGYRNTGTSGARESYTARRTDRNSGELGMATLSLEETVTADDFSALEQRIVRAVELVKKERAARTQADETAARLQSELETQAATLEQTQEQLRTLEKEREHVRQRVEKLLKQLDEITA